MARVVVGPIVGAASIIILVVAVSAATVAAVALIITTSAAGGIGEGALVLEAAPMRRVVSSGIVNSANLVAVISVPGVIPGRVIMCHMPSAGVTMAGINVAGAAGEYVAPSVVVVVGLVTTDGIYVVTPRSLKHYCLHPEFFEAHPSKVGSAAGVQQCALHEISPQIAVHESVLVVE